MARTYKHIVWIEHIGYCDYIVHGDAGTWHYLYYNKRTVIKKYNAMYYARERGEYDSKQDCSYRL